MSEVKMLDSLDKSIDKISYKGNMCIVGVNNKLLFRLVSCKEEIYHSIGKYYVFRDNPVLGLDMLGYGDFEDEFNENKSRILLYVNPKKPLAKARRINRVLKLLAKEQGLKAPIVYVIKNSNAVMIKPDPWYFRNPVALSGLLTFARGASKTSFVFNNLSNFLVKIIKNSSWRLSIGEGVNKNYSKDGEHFSSAKENGNLDGFLNKTLNIFKLKPLAAYSLGKMETDIPYDGIVNYKNNYVYESIAHGVYPDSNDYIDDEYDYCEAY